MKRERIAGMAQGRPPLTDARRLAPITIFLFLRYSLQSFKVDAEVPNQGWNDVRHLMALQPRLGANMGEVVRFIPKSERERARLIREARAIYDSIFPPADPLSEQQDKATDLNS
jgi:hypothetical protein